MSDGRAIAAIAAALGDMVGAEATLYRITPDTALRNRPTPIGQPRDPVVVVNLHFAISASNAAVLGAALVRLAGMVLLSSATIDPHIDDPALHGAIPTDEPVQLRPESLTLAEETALWIALQQPLRPALYCAIGPVRMA